MDIQLTLSVTELNMVLAALGERPFKDVHLIIRNIHDQALPQTQEKQDAMRIQRVPENGNGALPGAERL